MLASPKLNEDLFLYITISPRAVNAV
ncbi:hypothetical protein LINPERPRIM_LOCUS14696 [Linum perenne]